MKHEYQMTRWRRDIQRNDTRRHYDVGQSSEEQYWASFWWTIFWLCHSLCDSFLWVSYFKLHFAQHHNAEFNSDVWHSPMCHSAIWHSVKYDLLHGLMWNVILLSVILMKVVAPTFKSSQQTILMLRWVKKLTPLQFVILKRFEAIFKQKMSKYNYILVYIYVCM